MLLLSNLSNERLEQRTSNEQLHIPRQTDLCHCESEKGEASYEKQVLLLHISRYKVCHSDTQTVSFIMQFLSSSQGILGLSANEHAVSLL